MNTIGQLIKEIRKSEKMTQHQLAAASNVSRSYLNDVENNRYNPSVNFLKSISIGLSNGDAAKYQDYLIKFISLIIME